MTTITGKPIAIGQGWPLAEDIDRAVKSGSSIVSIYPVPGSGARPPQVLQFEPEILVAPVHGLSVAVDDINVTLSGTSNAGEIASLVANGKYYAHVSAQAETAATVAAALLTLVEADFPSASLLGAELTITGAYAVLARIGSSGVLSRKIHRQTVQIRIVVWSPNPADRTLIARTVDVAVKRALRLTMPDSSAAIITYEGTNWSDKEENAGIYRRDLILSALFDTLETFDATEIVGVPLTTTFSN